MQVARQAYAYLFFTERTANQRGFEDRQTQVRDYYNLAVQEASVQLYNAYATGRVHGQASHFQLGRWTFVLAPSDEASALDQRTPSELVPAASLSFSGSGAGNAGQHFGHAELERDALAIDDGAIALLGEKPVGGAAR
jgi:hypothetical protein